MSTPVLVTTAHRGVFFGMLSDEQNHEARSIVLDDCRNAIYWSGSRGFLGLASHGPENGSRIGSTAPRVLLHDVTSVTRCSDAAAKKWQEWPQ
jgi:hypothetical protein